jgi:hypothetical protein
MPRSKPLDPRATDCVVCGHFGYVQQQPGRWYPCPACHGSGRADHLGSQDPSVCVRDSTLDPEAWQTGTTQRAYDMRSPRKRGRDRAASARRRARQKEAS